MSNEKIILFDGVCNFCNESVKFIVKTDRRKEIKFATLQSQKGQELLRKFALPTNNFDSFVFIIGENFFLKSSATLNVLKEIGGVWKLFYVFIIIPKPIRDFAYIIIAKTRYRIFGRREVCIVPTEDIKHRFLK